MPGKVTTMKLEWLSQALLDFNEIIDFISTDNPVAAVEQGDEIESQVTMLLDTPDIGRPGRIQGTRELVVVRTPYIAAYRVKGHAIQILRILHSARRWPERI